MTSYTKQDFFLEGVRGEIIKFDSIVLCNCEYSNIHISKMNFREHKLHNKKLIQSLEFIVSNKKVMV